MRVLRPIAQCSHAQGAPKSTLSSHPFPLPLLRAGAISCLAPTSAHVLVPAQWRIPFFPSSPSCCCSTDCLQSTKRFSCLLCPCLQAFSQDTLRCSTHCIPPALDIKQTYFTFEVDLILLRTCLKLESAFLVSLKCLLRLCRGYSGSTVVWRLEKRELFIRKKFWLKRTAEQHFICSPGVIACDLEFPSAPQPYPTSHQKLFAGHCSLLLTACTDKVWWGGVSPESRPSLRSVVLTAFSALLHRIGEHCHGSRNSHVLLLFLVSAWDSFLALYSAVSC